MALYQNILPTVKQIQRLTQQFRTADAVLNSRFDAQVTASTDADADYAAEVVDGRGNAWGNLCGSLGSNIRGGQSRLSLAIDLAQALLQAQIDTLSESRLEDILNITTEAETRRNKVAQEEEHRISSDEELQRQINSLSEAVLEIVAILSEKRERQTGGTE